MKGIRTLGTLVVAAALVLVAGVSTAAPKKYFLTGKFTSNRGILINIPVVGNTPCGGVGLANLRIMSGPGLTGPLMSMQPKTTPATHAMSNFANGFGADYGCAPHAANTKNTVLGKAGFGKTVTTTGAGVGGAFTFPAKGLEHPFNGMTTAIHVPNAPPIIQLATSFHITGPRKTATLVNPVTPTLSMTTMNLWKNNFRKFQKNAAAVQPGRIQGAMFTYCWGNPGCAFITAGTKPLIVKYQGGGNAFGGTMSYIITAGANVSSIAIGFGAGVGFNPLPGMGSQVTGRGYGVHLSDNLAKGPLWNMFMSNTVTRPIVGKQKLITMVTTFLGTNFPSGKNFNRGFPWTTMTVLARNTGTAQGNKRATTLTAKGGDTVTAMGKRNISLVAGGMARAVVSGVDTPTSEITQLYLPEPGRTLQMLAGVAGLLAIAAWRGRKAR
jgi:hypothetical protein